MKDNQMELVISDAAMNECYQRHIEATGRRPTRQTMDGYTGLIRESLEEFQRTFRGVPFFETLPIHSFEALRFVAKGERYPRLTVNLHVMRTGKNKYNVSTSADLPLGDDYQTQRVMVEASVLRELGVV